MSKRVLSLFMALALCLSLLPTAVFAEDGIAEMDGNLYDTLQDALDEMNDGAEITLLGDVAEEEIYSYAATTIDMGGFSITGDIDASESLTLNNGTVIGSVTLSDMPFVMNAPAEAETAISGGLTVTGGACSISGAKIAVKGTLYMSSDKLFDISGTQQAVELTEEATLSGRTLYGSADENGETSEKAVFETDTYTAGGKIAKRLSNKQTGSQTPEPSETTITLAPDTTTIYGGQSAEFTVTYNGTDTLKAYIQKNGQDDTIDAAYDADTGMVTVTSTEEVKAGIYTLYVHEINDASINASADITVKNAAAKDSDGKYYDDIKTAVASAADGSTVTVIAKARQVTLPDGIYVETGSEGITLDLNGHSLDGYSLNVGGLTVTSKPRTGKLRVIDSEGGNGAVGITVRNGGTLIFEPQNVNTTLLQLVVYGGTIELRGGNIAAGKWELYNGIKLSELIPSDQGYAYRLYAGGNAYSSWITLGEAQNNTVSKNLALAAAKCEHAGVDTDGNCMYCGIGLAAKIGDKYYTSIKDAADAASENDTIVLLKDVADSLYVSKNITIDLNDKNIDTNFSPVNNTTLTLTGKGIINVVQSGTQLDGVVGGALKVLSDDVIVSTLSVQQIPSPAMNLSKGTFWKIELSDNLKDKMTANELLADGYAFASNGSGNVVNGHVYSLSDVKIVEHEHDMSTGECVCGLTCTHAKGFTDNGKCPDCGAECPHENVNTTTYVCAGCNQQMTVKKETKDGAVTYGTDLAVMMNASEDAAVVTLLKDTGLNDYVYIIDNKKTVTLDLNGHSVSRNGYYTFDIGGTSFDDSGRGGKLIIKGKGNIEAVLTAWSSGELDFGGYTGDKIGTLSVHENVSVTGISGAVHIDSFLLNDWKTADIKGIELSGGSYGEIVWNNFNSIELSLGSLLAEGYTFQSEENNTFVSYAEKLSPDSPVSISKVRVVKCTQHADSDGDGRCDYCNGQLAASVTGKNGESRVYTNLQDAIDTIDDSDVHTVTLLADALGSYTVTKGRGTRFILNGKTLNEIAFSGESNIAFNGSGTVNSVIFSGNKTRFNAGNPLIIINTMTVKDGATWSSILPNVQVHGYKVYNSDKSAYKWYDGGMLEDFLKDKNTVNNVMVNSLPVTKAPTLMIDGQELAEQSSISVYKPFVFSFEAYVSNGFGGSGVLFIQKDTDSAPTAVSAEGDCDVYTCPARTFDISETGTYKVWAEVSKEGYTRRSKVYTIDVGADLKDAQITLKQSEFTYTPMPGTGATEFTAEIDSVKLFGHDVPADAYSVSGDKGTDADDYTLTITANASGGYVGSAGADWTINPCVLSGVEACIYIKNYDGTTEITADNIGKNDSPPQFYYDGCPAGGIMLKYGEDYTLSDVKANFSKPDAGEYADVSFKVELMNSNYTFRDNDGSKTEYKTIGKGMYIGKAALPQGYEPDDSELIVRNGAAYTYTYDVSKLIKELPNGLNYGTTSYELESIGSVDNGYIDDGTVSINQNGILTVPVKMVNTDVSEEIAIVKVKVIAQNYADFTVTVTVRAKNKIVPTGEPTLAKNEITYGDKISSIELTGKMYDEVNNVEVLGTFAWIADGVLPAGTCLAGWIFTPNDVMYAQATGKVTITVNKADIPAADITPPTAAANLKYNGAKQNLITEGTTATGTMQYKLGENGTWGTAVPTAADAGSYDVYYRVAGGDNYNDTEEQKIECSIEKRPVTISNKPGDEGYKTEYMYGDLIQKPDISNFEITGSEGAANFSYQWIGEEPRMLSELGDYTLKVTVGETANTAGGSCEITVKIARNTRDPGYMSGFDYIVYSNAGAVSYEVDYAREIATGAIAIDRETLKLKPDALNIVIRDANGSYIPYDEDNCDFKISVEEGAAKGTVRVTLTGLNRDTTGLSFCIIALRAENKHYADIGVQLRLNVKEKAQKTLGVTMNNFTYGDNAGVPVYNAPEGTLETSVTYATKDGTDLTEAPTQVGNYTVTVVCETKDTTYSGSANYTINPKPISDLDFTLSEDTFTYNGGEQKPDITVKMNETALSENTDYTVTYPADTTNAGEKKMTVTGRGNFGAAKELVYTITPCTAEPTVDLSNTEYTYDGNEKKPSATVIIDNITLTEGKDYEVSYKNNKNAGTASVIITSKGNYGFSEFEKKFAINKANIKVRPKDVTKTYGKEAVFALEYDSELITYEELMQVTNPVFTSDGAAANAPVNETGYEISVLLTNNETDNLTFAVGSAGVLKVEKAPLTVTVNDVSREYGAENPELSVSYSGFVNGEDESVLGGTLNLAYDESITAESAVGDYAGKTTASGLTAENYAITYVPGNVTITKIPVNASAGKAGRTYLEAVFDKGIAGLSDTNFIVKDSEGNESVIKKVTASSDNQTYTLSGSFEYSKEYTVKATFSGAAADAIYALVTDEFVITPVRTNGGSLAAAQYTVVFETNGGSKLSNQTVMRNSALEEPAAPAKEGFDFAGWYTDKELKNKYDFTQKVTNNMTLYAAWTDRKGNADNRIILTVGEKSALVFGVTKTNDVAPIIANDRTMLPARFVAENLGANVLWDGEKKLVTITGKHLKTNEDTTILIYIGSDIAYVNGKEIKIDSPAFIENDRTYTPIRLIAEELGASVEWIETEQKVVITK